MFMNGNLTIQLFEYLQNEWFAWYPKNYVEEKWHIMSFVMTLLYNDI